MRDFTLEIYRLLLESLKKKGYSFVTYAEYAAGEAESVAHGAEGKAISVERPASRQIGISTSLQQRAMPLPLCILRHDVDLLPGNALITAKVEKDLGISGTYYFRIVPESFDEKIIKEIAELGHEVGYHYEELESPLLVSLKGREKGLAEIIERAYEVFKANLEKIRSVADVKTICMHGSPLSKYDNREIWSHRDANGNQYDYKELGIIGEPYFDIDWNEFGYLTDTGRRWDGAGVSVRDKVEGKYKFKFKSTQDIIDNIDSMPDKMMITIHPQRWTNDILPWTKELVLQNIKNVVKRFIVMNDD